MDTFCPDCGLPLAPPDDVCPRCAVVKALPPAVVPAPPVERDAGRLQDRRMLVGPDPTVRWSLRMLLAVGIGLVLLLFAVSAVLVWVLFGA